MRQQEFRADLHIHSRFSRATSKRLNLPLLAAWAALKGLDVIGTGDFTHPQWREELANELTLDEKSGLYALKAPGQAAALLPEWADTAFLRERAAKVRFMLQAEISSIYKRGGQTRKVHNLVFMPGLEQAGAFSLRLAQVGNLSSDGRPILGLDSENLLELALNTHDEAFLVPAHIWTPWFSLFGSKSGFDSLEECYGSLAGHIFALETGLSSDPAMNRRLSALDRLKLISNSDAHSGENLAREANIFAGEISYSGMLRALRAENSRAGHLPTNFLGTLEFFPDEGKYHLDGHRACQVRLAPAETRALNGICPVCGKPLTLGVLYRVQELADREAPRYRPDESFASLAPLPEIAGELLGAGPKSRKVGEFYQQLLRGLGPELDILSKTPLEDIGKVSSSLAEGIGRMRRGEVQRQGGYDGEFGVIRLFSQAEQKELPHARRLPGKTGAGLAQLRLLPEAAAAQPAGQGKKPATLPPAQGSMPDSPPGAPLPATQAVPAVPVIQVDPANGPPTQPPGGGASPTAFKPGAFDLGALNPGQAAAVQAGPGPVLALAGPGTGKTHTLAARILRLLQAGQPPETILAVTFTRRAAAELRERLARALGSGAAAPAEAANSPGSQTRQVRADTLHALAFEFWAGQPGETPVLLDEDGCLRVFAEANLEEGAQRRRAAWAAISLCREKMEPVPERFQTMYERYTQHKSAWNLADYTDLLEFWLTQAKSGLFPIAWSEVLVDEVQDLSPLQLELFRTLLPADGRGFFGIGDPDQSIYGFRGAHGQVEDYFKAAWPGLQCLHLAENYRSGPAILDLAQIIFNQKAERLLLARRDLPAEIHYFESNSAEREATWVAERIRHYLGATSHSLLDQTSSREAGALLRPGLYTPGDIAILVRSRLFMPPLRKALERAGIPCSQPSQDPFWNDPLVQRLLEAAGRALGISPALAGPDGGAAAPPRGRAPLECPAAVLSRGPLSMAAYFGNSDPFESRFWKTQPFKDFSAAFAAQNGWTGLFNWLALQNELEQTRALGERVLLLTYHAAKGLEFPLVFLPALEDGILPFAGAAFLTGQLDSCAPGRSPLDGSLLEEEKRLFYVGLTRAQEGLFLSRSEKRRLYGRELRLKPSRFLSRLPIRKVRHSAVTAKVVTTQEQMPLF